MKPQPGVPAPPSAGDCYRFVLSNPSVDVCLSGPRNGEDLRAAIEAVRQGAMSEEELAQMRRVGDGVRALFVGK